MKVRIKSEKNQNLDVLLDKLNTISTLEKKDIVNYFEHMELEWNFLSIIDFGSSYSIESKKRILGNTFKILVKNNRFEKNYFLEQIEIQINHHNRKNEETYFLLTTLSISNLPFRKIILGESIIHIHGKQFPKDFMNHRSTFFKSNNIKPENKNFTKVSVEVKSKDFKDAYEKAYQFLENFRSFLCLILNSPLEIRLYDPLLEPINKVRQGMTSTLHTAKGNPVDKNYYWYVPDYKEAKVLKLDSKKKENIKKSVRWMISCYNKCKPKHQETIGKALNNYVGAFDESNKYICFLKSWTVLEILSNTDQNDLLIKRCTAMFGAKDKAYQKQKLEGLRLYRNEYMHEGDNGLDPMIACFFVQSFIYILFVEYNFKYCGFFENIDEANLFLDSYTPDLKELKTRKKILDKAIYIKEKNTKR